MTDCEDVESAGSRAKQKSVVEDSVMRRQLVSLMFAGLIGMSASPLAVAGGQAGPAEVAPDRASAAPVAVQRVGIPANGLRDEAAMVLVGTALIGLAAAVKRAA
jgi:hypothetical protein